LREKSPQELIYILLTVQDWERAQERGYHLPESFAAEGFIHASPPEQLTRVANKYYAQASDVRILCIDPEKAKSPIKWEPASGPSVEPTARGLYPHIYGPLNLDAVVKIRRTFRDSDGKIRIDPKEL
jgi:uncharacterized protein (DUF952 family)